jgi:hypothetical protein
MNRYAIGRFLSEFVKDLKFSLGESSSEEPAELSHRSADDISMIIYSGHDSTLVPVLCALGIYDGIAFANLFFHFAYLH